METENENEYRHRQKIRVPEFIVTTLWRRNPWRSPKWRRNPWRYRINGEGINSAPYILYREKTRERRKKSGDQADEP